MKSIRSCGAFGPGFQPATLGRAAHQVSPRLLSGSGYTARQESVKPAASTALLTGQSTTYFT